MLNIKRASCADGPVVSQLLKEKYSFKDLPEANQAFSLECSNQHFRLAEENGQVVGLISWRTQGTIKHGVIELTRIAVSASMPNTAEVKEMLFDVMVAEADFYYKEQGGRLRKIFSLIHADNKAIKEFFLNKGMQQEAVLRNHYHLGTDELVFSLFFGS